MRLFFLFATICLCLVSCKNNSTETTTSTTVGNDYDVNGLNKNYDFTGTYELKDFDILYTLKLHKRSVDGSYEMQFYNNSKNADIYKSSIYDAKDDSTTIYIRFLNNFQMDATSLGFKSGDTLFVLQHLTENDNSVFKAFEPKNRNVSWIKINNQYN